MWMIKIMIKANQIDFDVLLIISKVDKIVSKYTLFYRKLRSDLSTQSFLAFCEFEYSKFLNSFLTLFLK